MSKDYTLRIPSQENVLTYIKNHTTSVRELEKLGGSFWKPISVSLVDFNPRDRAVRIRTFSNDKAKAEDIIINHDQKAYITNSELLIEGTTTECENKLSILGFEKWVDYTQFAIEYTIQYQNITFNALDEIFNDLSTTIKFEADSSEVLQSFLVQFNIDINKLENLNTAELLAKQAGLL